MKKSELRELQGKKVEELQELVAQARRELLKGRFERVTEGQGLGIRARKLRREIARYLTLINAKQQAAAKAEVKA